MKIKSLFVLIILSFLFSSCGYRNPYIYTGPDTSIYITSWKNRTSELQLESQMYRSLVEWYQKSKKIKVVKNKEEANLILAGEIISIELPSLSYGSKNTTEEVKLKLKVRYIMKDLKSGEILFQQPKKLKTEAVTVTSDESANSDKIKEALEDILDEFSQEIYLKTLAKLSKK